MATSIVPPSTGPAGGRPRRWTCDEFHQLSDEGWFEGERVILVDGEVIEMPAPNPPHDMAVGLTDYLLKGLFGAGYWVRVQTGLPLGQATDPVPDIAVVPGSPRSYPQHPSAALLVVEISDTSLAYDTTAKANLYAAGGIADYWVVDLVNRRLLIFRDPLADATQPFGHRYATVLTTTPGNSASPLALPAATVRVDDLLP